MGNDTDLILSRRALTSVEAARAYLQRAEYTTEDEAVVDAVNEATGYMEAWTQRRLRERLYTNPQTVTLTATADSVTFTGTGLGVLRVGADAYGDRLRIESVLASIAGDGLSLTLSQPAESAGSVAVSFGSEPLTLEWPGGRKVSVPEWPVEAVYSVKIVERDGTRTAMDVTNAILRKQSGVLELVNDYPARGQIVEIECRAGYRPQTNTERGHREDWSNLSRCCHRIAQILFQDYRTQLGRTMEVQIRDQIVRFADMRLPKDVEQILGPYLREDV